MKSIIHFVSSLVLVTAAALPAQAISLQISEVFYDPAGSDNGLVFVELYGASGLSLDGYRVEGVNGSGGAVGPTLSLTGSIPGDGFFVIADLDGATTAVPNADLTLNFDFQNGPDSIVLRDPADSIVDALGYGSFGAGDVFAGEGSPAPDPPSGQSVARLFANVDTNDNGVDFVALETPTPGGGPIAVPESGAVSLMLLAFCATGWRWLSGIPGSRFRR